MRVLFIPPSQNDFKKLLLGAETGLKNKSGGGLSDISVFTPYMPTRRGGGIFSTIAQNIIPFLTKTLKPVAQEFGANVARDVLIDKKNLKSSLKNRCAQALKSTARRIVTGRGRTSNKGRKRRGVSSSSSRAGRPKKKRRRRRAHPLSPPIKDVYSLLN